MNTFKEAAIEILKKTGNPLHYKEITRLALENGLLETQGATPEATMNAQITVDIKYKKESSLFVKIAPGTFGLNIIPDIPQKQQKLDAQEKAEEDKIKIESGFVGKAGEHLVCSELLFRGFNASIMSVDVGLDIVATKDSRMFGIQVKTSNLNRFRTYVFDVRKVSFERHSNNSVFYIFVLHKRSKSNFLILPYYEMERKVHDKAILEVNKGNSYRISIKIRDNKIYLGNMNHEVTYFLNNWEIIK